MFRDAVTDLVAHFSLPPSLGSYSINENKRGKDTRGGVELLFIGRGSATAAAERSTKMCPNRLRRLVMGREIYRKTKLHEKGAGKQAGQSQAVPLDRHYQSCIKAFCPGKISSAGDCFWTLCTAVIRKCAPSN